MSEQNPQLTEAEEREVEERSPPKAKVVHAAVAKQGDDELDRPVTSLFWSGVAAGIAIMASVHAEAALRSKLPDAPWRDVIASLGYSLGFVIVILGRMQLFTEHTTVAVLPVAKEPSRRNFVRLGRLWTLVFVGNVVGAAAAAVLVVFGHIQSHELFGAMVEVSSRLLAKGPGQMLLQAIPAGFLIASVAWIRSATDDSSFLIVVSLTYVIGIAGFTHVIAGAAEAFILLFSGNAGVGWLIGTFLLPALIGNIIGGTGFFAMLAHAQVKEEI